MLKHTFNSRKQSGTRASNQFKIVVIGLPNAGTTHLINRLLNTRFTQTKRFKVYHCSINTTTFVWRETNRNYQLPANNKSCIRAVIFEVIATKTIIDLLYLLIAPEDIILLVYDPSLLSTASYMADIDYILNFVSAHRSAECCSSALKHHFPLILIMGIHTVPSMNLQANYFPCDNKPYKKHILQLGEHSFQKKSIFSEHKTPEYNLLILKKLIIAVAKPVYTQHCPSAYIHFEKTILSQSESRSLLTKAQVMEIACQAGIETTEQPFELIEYFRKKGIILYYPKVQALENKIFVSPHILYHIICVFEQSECLSFQEAFELRSETVKKALVHLLKAFDLAVAGHWANSKALQAGFLYDGTPFVIPSLLDTKVVSKKLNPKDYVGVVYYFPGDFLPKCVFYQLMTRLINWFHSDENTISCIELSRELFQLESKKLNEVEVQLNDNGMIKCYIKISPNKRAIKESLYPDLIEFIQDTLIKLCDFCLPSAQKPVCYLECPFDHENNKELHLLFNEISSEKGIICKITNTPVPKVYYASLLRSSYGEIDDTKDKEAYALALREGKAKPFSIRILIVGAENSGKTCLVESLLGGDFKSYSNATQGADMTVCKFFTTNWLRVQDEQMPKKLQKDFYSKWKATVMEQSFQGDQIPSSSSVHESNLEQCIPSITVTSPGKESTPVQSSLNRQLSLPIDELPELSMEDIKEAELSSPLCENEVNAVIWDVSGQTVYHGLLPAFLTEDNVAIITFDASQDLYNFTKAREDSVTENSINRKMTTCQVVCYWCKAIYSICRKKGTHDSLSRFLPTIFLVATHIDKIGDNRVIEKAKGAIIGLLAQELTGKPYAQLLAGNCGSDGIEDALKKYCFFVSNLDRNPDVFCQLKKAIVASCQHIINQRHPVIYLKIENQLLTLNKSTITTTLFHKIAKDCGFLPKFESKKFASALQYFHSKGIIMHFPAIESLKDVIVLSPQWLVKLLAFVIIAHPFKHIGSSLDSQYDLLIKEGVLYKEFFDHMVNEFNKWSEDHNCSVTIEPKQAMDFVKSFYIVAEIDKNAIFLSNVKYYDKPAVKDELYIVPSMLPEEIPEVNSDELLQNIFKNKKLGDGTVTHIIYFKFLDGFVPTMTFLQVITACIKRNTSRGEELSWLSRHHCKMVLGDNQYYYISLNEDQGNICLIMTLDESNAITNDELDQRRELVEYFRTTLINIVKSLSKVADELQTPVPYVPCPQCDRLHFTLDIICNAKKRVLRCKTKLPMGYYSNLAVKADDNHLPTLQDPPDKKKLKLSSEPGTPSVPLLTQHLYDVIQWEEFGLYLLPEEYAATEIEIIRKNHPNDIKKCKRRLYTVYLEQGANNWERVVEALEKSKYPHIAKNIKEIFL